MSTRKLFQDTETGLKKEGRIQVKVLFFQPPHISHKPQKAVPYMLSTVIHCEVFQFLYDYGQNLRELTLMRAEFLSFCQKNPAQIVLLGVSRTV